MQKNSNSQNSRYMLGVVAICTLVVGFFLGFSSNSVLSFFNGALGSKSYTNTQTSDYYDSEYVNSILKVIKDQYINPLDSKDKKTAAYGVIKGYIDSLEDPYTFFLEPEEAKDYLGNRRADFEGIGVTLQTSGKMTSIESVLKGFPAEKGGLLPKDIILKVDNKDISGFTTAKVAELIRGKKGTQVTLLISRKSKDESKQMTFKITREKIVVDNINWEKINDSTARINISQFNDETVKAFLDNWDEIVNKIDKDMPNLKNVIVDLRGNPGGYVAGVSYIAEEFLKDKQIILKESSRTQGDQTFYDERKGKFEDKNVYVLVNEGSASASEILAAAIAENNRGVVIGKPTVGKGVEQQFMNLDDGSILFLVFQKWLTPNGNEISKEKPIKPQYDVDFDVKKYEKGVDTQLQKALELIN